MADISRAYQKLGYRQIAMLQPASTTPETPLDRRLEAMMQAASYYLYEGDFQQASTTLARARALAETAPEVFPKRFAHPGLSSGGSCFAPGRDGKLCGLRVRIELHFPNPAARRPRKNVGVGERSSISPSTSSANRRTGECAGS